MSTKSQFCRRFHTVYQITNLNDGKIYVGCHSTDNINDGYMGSGFRLRNAMVKEGKESFMKEILFVFDNAKKMFDKEKEIVNEDFISRSDTYNMVLGGSGGPNKGIIGQKRMFNPKTGKRIVVHQNAVDKMLHEGFVLRSGWSTHSGRKYVHLNGKIMSVRPEDLDSMLQKGWNIGMPSSPTSGQVWVYHTLEDRYSLCPKSELETYLANGWIRKKWAPIKKGTSCWVNDGKINKRIPLASMEEHISQGWKRGALQNH